MLISFVTITIYCNFRPKITIENGNKLEDAKKVPISEVKPIKKENKKMQEKNENRLEVDSRKHKSKEHKSTHRSKERETRDVAKSAVQETVVASKKDTKLKEEIKPKSSTSSSKTRTTTKESKDDHKHKKDDTKEKGKESMDASQKRHVFKQSSGDKKPESKSNEQDNHPQSDLADIKANSTISVISTSSSNTTTTVTDVTQTTKVNSESAASQTTDRDKSEKIVKNTLTVAGTSHKPGKKTCTSAIVNGNVKGIKPPNVLVYADSLIAKENVKNVLNTILNRDK